MQILIGSIFCALLFLLAVAAINAVQGRRDHHGFMPYILYVNWKFARFWVSFAAGCEAGYDAYRARKAKMPVISYEMRDSVIVPD